MKISYAITSCNETEELKKLIPFLIDNKHINDEIIILHDDKNGSEETLSYLLKHNLKPNVQTWRGMNFRNNFGEWKNKLNAHCSGDYIFQIDADEIITEFLIKNIHDIIETNNNVDLFYLSRVNIVEGITENDLSNWGWIMNDRNWINFPDKQGRIYRNGLNWFGKIHERIVGANVVSQLPDDYDFCLIHVKEIERQRKQNEFYQKLNGL